MQLPAPQQRALAQNCKAQPAAVSIKATRSTSCVIQPKRQFKCAPTCLTRFQGFVSVFGVPGLTHA